MSQKGGWRSEMPNGDANAAGMIADLYTTEREALLRYASSLTREPGRAEDLVQDAFVRAMSHLDLLAELTRGQRRAWLYRAIKNRFIDQARRVKRWNPVQSALERDALEVSDPVLADVRLWELLDAVPANHREILCDRYVLGLNSTEIGERRGIPAATARSRLRLATAWMREHQGRLLRKE